MRTIDGNAATHGGYASEYRHAIDDFDGHGARKTQLSNVVAVSNEAPTGSVILSGAAMQGQTLTVADTLDDADGLGKIGYQWQLSSDGNIWSNISGASFKFFKLTESQVGMQMRVIASYVDDHGTQETVASKPTKVVANLNDEPKGTIALSGTPAQGQTLTATGALTDEDGLGTLHYQWQYSSAGNAWSNIIGATGDSYTLLEDQVDRPVRLIVSYVDDHGTKETLETRPTRAIINLNDAPTGSVTIAGEVMQGQILSAANTLADADGLGNISYQWQFSNGGNTWINISDATAKTYKLLESEVGKSVHVVASYYDDHGTREIQASEATDTVANLNDAPTGSVTFSGSAIQGQLLTAANTLDDADGLGEISYQWQVSDDGSAWSDISGATAKTYKLAETQVGRQVRVVAGYSDDKGTAEIQASRASKIITNLNDEPMGAVTIEGAALQGQTLIATDTLTDVDGLGGLSYQWGFIGERNTWVNIGGANTSSYTLLEDQVDKPVRVTVTYIDGHGKKETLISAATKAVANLNDAPTGSVTVSGIAVQGQILAAAHTLADADGMGEISYQWQSSNNGNTWSNISGATGKTYKLEEFQVGQQVRVIVSYVDDHRTRETVESIATEEIAGVNDAQNGTITISGVALQGQILTAAANGLRAISYQWQHSGDGNDWYDIDGATAKNYKLLESQVGEQIRATVTYGYIGDPYSQETQSSRATKAVVNLNDEPTGTVTISGNPIQGQTLTAGNTLIDADGLGAFNYQWQFSGDGNDWSNINGATADTHTLTDALVGKSVRVSISYFDGHGTKEVESSIATRAVASFNDPPTGTVTLNGTATQGQNLSASNTLADADGLGPINYQWQYSLDGNTWVDISGATDKLYKLPEFLVGKQVRATASYIDDHGTAETVASAATEAIANFNDAPEGSVTISGTPTQGQILTAANTLADADGLGEISYQWQFSKNGNAWSDISGATTKTYKLLDAQVGQQVRVTASYSDDHGTAESEASAATRAIENFNDEPTGTVTLSGDAIQGQLLTADNSLADADGLGAIGYQWQASGNGNTWSDINGATAKVYKLADAQVGEQVRVTAGYTDGHGTRETLASNVSKVVANINDAPTGSVTLNGTPTQGKTLTAVNALDDEDGLGTFSYQWQSSSDGRTWNDIGGATTDTYRLLELQVDKQVRVMVSYADGRGTAETQFSAATRTIANRNDEPTGTVTISGIAKQGQRLSVTDTLADADGMGAISYHWQSAGVEVASGERYMLAAGDAGKPVTVVARYTDGHGTAESVASPATALVEALPPGVSLTRIGAADTGEDGSVVSYALSLNTRPVREVNVNFRSSDTSEGVIEQGRLTFDAGNWAIPQTLTIQGIDDYLDDHDVAYSVTAMINTMDVNYARVTLDPIDLLNLDNGRDTPVILSGDANGVPRNDILAGRDGPDRLYGLLLMDDISGGMGDDRLYGDYDDDKLYGGAGNDQLFGEQDDDYLQGEVGDDTLDGGLGKDTMIGGPGDDLYYLGYDAVDVIRDEGLGGDKDVVIMPYKLSRYTLPSGIENASIDSGAQASTLIGNLGNNALTGNDGNNGLIGGGGRDTLLGGQGSDTLTGGALADRFVYNAINETGLNAAMDVISSFTPGEGDKIDLTGMDADPVKSGDQAFTYIGEAVFSGAGQMRFDAAAHILYGSTDTDNAAEFAIQINGITDLYAVALML